MQMQLPCPLQLKRSVCSQLVNDWSFAACNMRDHWYWLLALRNHFQKEALIGKRLILQMFTYSQSISQ